MIREGDYVRVVPREKSPPSQKYAGQTGIVTMTSPSVYGPGCDALVPLTCPYSPNWVEEVLW